MAKEAYETAPLTLSDGTEVTLKPLKISALKRFMKAFDEMKKVDEENKDEDALTATDVLVNCTGICLESELKEKVEETRPGKGDEGWLSDKYREYLEDTIEMPTIYRVLEVCADMKLNDPQLLRAAAEAAAGKD